MNRRYIALLAVAAVITLGAGLFVRQLLRPEAPAASVAPPSGAAALLQLSEEAQVRRFSSFLSERATDVSALVEFVGGSNSSGLRWVGGDSLITTSVDQPVVSRRVAPGDTTRIPSFAPSDSVHGKWVLIVARRPDGGVVSMAGIVGGDITTRCADRDAREYVLGVSISDAFAGAGIFDLSGRAVGFVARCGARLVPLPLTAVRLLMTSRDSASVVMADRIGVEAQPLDSAARSYFGVDSGLLVTTVHDDGPAGRAGLAPGDIITAIDGIPIDSILPAAAIDSLAAADSHVVTRLNGAGTTRLTIRAREQSSSAQQSTLGIELARGSVPAGVEIRRVQPGALASRAGLKTGDRLLRVGRVAVSSVTSAQRALTRLDASDSLIFIVFRRDSVSRGALVRR